MPRIIDPLITNHTYHVYNRGANKQPVFLDKEDSLRFYISLDIFNTVDPVESLQAINLQKKSVDKSTAKQKLVEIEAFSLLDNHYHLLMTQLIDGGISEFMKRISGGYTGYFNNKHERNGVLFQGRFKRVMIKREGQYEFLFKYVNENHFVHNLPRPDEICYSSSLHYQGKMKSKIIKPLDPDYIYDFKDAVQTAIDLFTERQDEKLDRRLLQE